MIRPKRIHLRLPETKEADDFYMLYMMQPHKAEFIIKACLALTGHQMVTSVGSSSIPDISQYFAVNSQLINGFPQEPTIDQADMDLLDW